MSDELVAFLRARLDEDEQAARECARIYPSPWDVSDRGSTATVRADEPDFRVVTELEQWKGQPEGVWLGAFVDHIARHDPARVLRNIKAMRRIVNLADRPPEERHASDMMSGTTIALSAVLTSLAGIWIDHPDFNAQRWLTPSELAAWRDTRP